MKGPKKREYKTAPGISAPSYAGFFSGDDFTRRPCFSFQNTHPRYGAASCDEKQRSDLCLTLERLSALTWTDIEGAHRHGLGAEKISRDAIKPDLPGGVPKSATLLAIRFSGKAPMIGYRERNIFHIVFLDGHFSVYNHGA
ncbi:MAG: hypothetical protein MdMp014T_2890 [Treponematales bacterium]